jgi:hypothetical protein
VTHERDDKRSERDFEAYLEGDSEVSQSYARLKGVEPPEFLDRAVLAQAEAAADETRGRRRRPFWSSWSPRIAAVAVVTLAVAVTLRLAVVPERTPQALERDLSSPTAGRAASLPVADADSPDQKLNDSVGTSMAMTEAEEQLELSEVRSLERERSSATAGRAASLPVADADSPNQKLNDSVGKSMSMTEAEEQLESDEVRPMPDPSDPGSLITLMQSYSLGRPREYAAAELSSPAAAPPGSEDEAVPVPPAGPAAGYNDASARTDSPDVGVSEGPTVAGQEDTDPRPWRTDPERWLEYVDRLIEDRDDEAVRRELAAFREDWPDVELAERYETWLVDSAK